MNHSRPALLRLKRAGLLPILEAAKAATVPKLFMTAMVLVGWAVPAWAVESPRFEEDILPILYPHCFACHSEKQAKPKGKLRLDSADSIRASRQSPAPQAGYRTAAYLSQHNKIVIGKRGADLERHEHDA